MVVPSSVVLVLQWYFGLVRLTRRLETKSAKGHDAAMRYMQLKMACPSLRRGAHFGRAHILCLFAYRSALAAIATGTRR